METNFNFKSQIATDKNQSERLLSLGLKKETADCVLPKKDNLPPLVMSYNKASIYTTLEIIPAWSLHRLLSLIPKELYVNVIPMSGRNYRKWVCFNMDFAYNIIYFDGNNEDFVGFYEGDVYDKAISCIEWLIKEGYFNKEYLV